MRKRELLRLSWRDTALGLLTEVSFVGALLLMAALATLLVARGVR